MGLRPGWRLFLYLGLGALVFFVITGLGRIIFRHGYAGLWAQLYVEFALAAASLLSGIIMAAVEKRPFASYGLSRGEIFGKRFWLGIAWGIVALSSLMLLMHGFGVFTFGHIVLHGARILKFGLFWGVFFLLVGFFEEFTFRGYSLFTLTQEMNFWRAAVPLSVIFGAIHLSNPGEGWLGALCAGLIGLFFCFTVPNTGSLWFAVGMHTSWDWGESFLYSVPDSGGTVTGHLLNSSFHGSRWLTGGSVGPEGSVLVFVVIAAVWVVFDRVYPAKRVT